MSPRQVERWRQNGWLPRRTRHFPGRGLGSVSEPDPPRVLYQVLAVAALLKAREKSTYIPAALFGQGFQIDEGRLRASFTAVLLDVRSYIQASAEQVAADRAVPGPENRSDEASTVAALIARRRPRGSAVNWKKRLRRRGAGAWWAETLYTMLDLTHAAILQTAEAFGRVLTAAGLPVAGVLDDLAQYLSFARLDRVESALSKASFDDILKARDMLNDVLDAAVALRLQFPHTPVIEGIDDALSWEPLQRAVAILYFVAIRQRKGKIYDRIIDSANK